MSSLPSGIRLMSLLREHLDEIMGRERTNLTSIHLYCTGLYWVAFERSAYQLYRAFPDSEIMPMRLYAYPFPIVMVSVTDRPPDIAQALALFEGEQGDDGVNEFLALDKFGRFYAVAKDLVEKVGQHRLAEGGYIRALGDSLHEVVTHLLVLDIGG